MSRVGASTGRTSCSDSQGQRSTSVELELSSVGVRFTPEGRPSFLAVDDASLSVRKGEFLALVGPSGCGKSTLLRVMAGLLEPTHGAVRVADSDVTGPRADVTMVFQAPRLLPWRSIVDNVILPLRVGRGERPSREEMRSRAAEMLALVGLEGFESHYPGELSGGMQQRASIARSLVTEAPILLMDEPFGALDAFTREFLNEELLRIWQSTGKTIVFVTHDMDEAVFLADRIVVMAARPGRVADIVDVPLARPRIEDVRSSTEFFQAVRDVREALRVGSAGADA